MQVTRASLAAALLILFAAGDLTAQQPKKKPGSDDEGYVPVVAPEGKNKKKDQDLNQTLPPERELPSTMAAETDRLVFQVSPLSSRGLLSQQTRDALKALLKTNHGTIVKLRAFVSGSGDLRRVGELVGETFTEKRQPLPVLTVVQVGALPMEGAQIVIESAETDRKVVNPNGVAFLSAQPAASVAESLGKLKSVMASNGIGPSDALSVACFVSALDAQRDSQSVNAAGFSGVAFLYVQMRREPVTPATACEARARMASPKSSIDSQAALVSSPQVVFTGTQLAFGAKDADLKLAFDRLEKTLASRNTSVHQVVTSHLYVASNNAAAVAFAKDTEHWGANPPTSTMLPIEGLPSLDALLGIEVVAVADGPAER